MSRRPGQGVHPSGPTAHRTEPPVPPKGPGGTSNPGRSDSAAEIAALRGRLTAAELETQWLAQARHTAEVAVDAERQANEQLDVALAALRRVQALCNAERARYRPEDGLIGAEYAMLSVTDVLAALGANPEERSEPSSAIAPTTTRPSTQS